MKNLVQINTRLGWVLIIGIIITQLASTIILFESGGMQVLIAFLIAALFFPFFIIAISSVLNRERNLTKIKIGIWVALLFQVGLPITLTLFFDHEFIYLSLVGFLFGVIIWYFRERVELQLLILNGIGAILWLFISIGDILSTL